MDHEHILRWLIVSLFIGAAACAFCAELDEFAGVEIDDTSTLLGVAGLSEIMGVTITSGAVTPHPLADWPQTNKLLFAYANPTNGADDIGSGNLLTYNSATPPTYVDATNGVDFTPNDLASAGTNTMFFNGLTTASISCWLRRDATGTTQPMTVTNSSEGIGFQVLTAGARGILKGTVTGYVAMPILEWHMVTLTYENGATPDARFYLDGVYVSSVAISAGSLTMAAPYLFGGFAAGNSHYDGKVDDMGGWSSVLTSNEVYTFWTKKSGDHP